MQNIGTGWMERLHTQEPRIYGRIPEITPALSSGRDPHRHRRPRRGGRGEGCADRPRPRDLGHVSAVGALVRGTPHPDVAELFLTWLYYPEAQAALSASGLYPLVKGAPLPDGFTTDDSGINTYSAPEDGVEVLKSTISLRQGLLK